MVRIDVVVPCYNYGRFLRQCVQSVLDQAGVHVRVLVIDDASSDDTAEIAACLVGEDPRVSFVRHTENRGHINTYNEGIAWVSAECMLLLSADDYLLPGGLRRAAELMSADPNIGLVFGNVIELDESGKETPGHCIIRETCVMRGDEFIELTGAENIIATCSAVVRTDLQKRVGGYRNELPHAGDMEMWLRFAVHSSIGFISDYQGVYRQHRANMSTVHYSIEAGQLHFRKGGRLTDLRQRKMALDCFSDYCREAVPERECLCRGLYRRLSRIAVMRASEAFNERQVEEVGALLYFAHAVCPEIKRSSGWLKLSCKRLIGVGPWNSLKPGADAIRTMRQGKWLSRNRQNYV